MTHKSRDIDLAGLHHEVESLLLDVPAGEPLAPVVRALAHFAVRSSVTTLDLAGARTWAATALDAGATVDQLQEVLTLVSGLGVHTLMEGSRDLADLLADRGEQPPPADEHQTELRERLLGGAPYWDDFERYVPGFLDSLLRLSPEAFEGFITYGAIPSRTRYLRPVVKEIISIAVDALPNHRYLPGLRLHLANALRLGAGRSEILEAVGIASAAPEPPGVR